VVFEAKAVPVSHWQAVLLVWSGQLSSGQLLRRLLLQARRLTEALYEDARRVSDSGPVCTVATPS
jgi:hypothetical protein